MWTATLSIAIIVRFVDVIQSSFRLWSINIVSGNILHPSQQVQLGSQLAPAPLPAALVVHLEVLKNCLIQASDVFDVKMIQIWTFPAAPSTERVPSLAERVANLRYSINLRLFNWRVPVLQIKQAISILIKVNIRCSDEDTNLFLGRV